MSFDPISWFEAEVPLVEADIQKFVANILNDVQVVVTDLEKGLSWLAAETPAIAAGVAQLSNFAEALAPAAGPGGAAIVNAAVATASVAMAGLQAFAASYNKATVGGGITATQAGQALVTGYQALTAAKAAVNNGASTAIKAASPST